jgi:thymidylate synthase (FAD)
MSITLRSNFGVDLIEHAGSDQLICRAARVSTLGAASLETKESDGLINFLMKNRHGSPFEHGYMCFRITAPIFVWREFMRHRIGFSYNEQSGRYMELEPEFYVPPPERALEQVGKPGHYEFVPGSKEMYDAVFRELKMQYKGAWSSYQIMLGDGIAKEVARICLPVGIYSTAYVSCNPRSIMSFLSLRTKDPASTFPSFPQWEINQVADLIEDQFQVYFPGTHAAFHANGRVSP